MLPDQSTIRSAETGDLSTLEQLDSRGFLIAPGETAPDYAARLRRIVRNYTELEARIAVPETSGELLELNLKAADRIPAEILNEAAGLTQQFYDFSLDWVPAFFTSKGLGLFFGGCTASDEEGTSVFIIRSNFLRAKKWFCYSRDELLAHELCHAARVPVNDRIYEEHFAYALSNSLLRRQIGNCFRTEWDAVLFLAPVLLLLAVQLLATFSLLNLPVLPFWIPVILCPGLLLIRNYRTRRIYFKAERNLTALGVEKPSALLFRCNAEEIREIAVQTTPALLRERLREKASCELRWRLIQKRYSTQSINEQQTKGDS